MIETHPPRRIGRSIVAVIAGMLVGIVLTLGTDVVLHAVGVFPPWGASMVGFDGPLLLATVYRTVYGVLGSYIIARLAPDRPMQHALVGGFLGLVVSIVGDILQRMQPHHEKKNSMLRKLHLAVAFHAGA
jgi:uncharacterized MnhB-related membrane protein